MCVQTFRCLSIFFNDFNSQFIDLPNRWLNKLIMSLVWCSVKVNHAKLLFCELPANSSRVLIEDRLCYRYLHGILPSPPVWATVALPHDRSLRSANADLLVTHPSDERYSVHSPSPIGTSPFEPLRHPSFQVWSRNQEIPFIFHRTIASTFAAITSLCCCFSSLHG